MLVFTEKIGLKTLWITLLDSLTFSPPGGIIDTVLTSYDLARVAAEKQYFYAYFYSDQKFFLRSVEKNQ